MMSRLLSALRSKWPKASQAPYPLSLVRAEVSALAGLLEQPEGWRVYRLVCERYAALAFEEMQSPNTATERVHFLRGQISAALYLADLPDLIITKSKEYNEHQRRAQPGTQPDPARFWGSEYYRRDFDSGPDA